MKEERVTFKSGDLTLEGMIAYPDGAGPHRAAVVCHPHPLYGGSMDNNVVEALRDAALQEGIGALRFNFRGVGASGGSHGGGEPETDDVLAVLEAARGLHIGSGVSLAGYSFGAARAAAAAARTQELPASLVLVSPPLRSSNGLRLPAGRIHQLLIAGDRDQACPVEALDALATSITPSPDCIIIEGADHSWWGYEDELRDTVGGFLRWHALPDPA